MSDVGGSIAVTNKTLTFDSSSTNFIPASGPIASGTFAPADHNSGYVFAAPAPVGSVSASLDTLKAINPNGVWSLYVVDDTVPDSGFINGGWSLNLSTVNPISASANLALGMTASPTLAVAGGQYAYTLNVTNLGPDDASDALLTNVLPAGLMVVSQAVSQGVINYSGGAAIVDLGPLSAGSNATVSITVSPGSSGTYVSTAAVASAEIDLNTTNNIAVVSELVNDASADVQLLVKDAPDPVVVGHPLMYTMTVSNAGPNDANNVVVANTQLAAAVYQSATTSQGTFSVIGSQVNFIVGTLPAGGSALLQFTVVPGSVGTLSGSAVVSASTGDPVPANNTANFSTSVVAPSPAIVPAGIALAAESFVAADNAIEPGETVTLRLALRNSGSADTTNLVATLRATNGVVLSAGAQVRTYGVLAAGGGSVAMPFTFTASSTAVSSLTAVLDLQDGSVSLGSVSFALPLSTVSTFSSVGVVLIPSIGNATPYPSTVVVSNVAFPLAR